MRFAAVRQRFGLAIGLLLAGAFSSAAAGVTYEGNTGPGRGKHIVLVAGDDAEYHSEEALPQLAKILALRHGFRCTVLFSVDPKDGTIDPRQKQNIPGLEVLRSADVLVVFVRWRDLPDDQMKYFAEYVESGKPIIGIRTGTHAFDLKSSKTYEQYSWKSKIPGWEGGFGRRILGETWIDHHGKHGKQSTRALIAPGAENSPILKGIRSGEIWGATDTYEVRLPMPKTCRPLLLGQVLTGLKPDDSPVEGAANKPMMPVAWTNTYRTDHDRRGRSFTTTVGSADDFENEALRRLFVNAVYWASGLSGKIPAKADVTLVGEYHPHYFLSEDFTKGVKPEDLALR